MCSAWLRGVVLCLLTTRARPLLRGHRLPQDTVQLVKDDLPGVVAIHLLEEQIQLCLGGVETEVLERARKPANICRECV